MDTLPNSPSIFAYLSLLIMHEAMAWRVAVLLSPLAVAWILQRRAMRPGTDVWYVLAGFYLGLILIPPRLEVFWFDALWVLLAYAAASIAILNWRDPQNPRA